MLKKFLREKLADNPKYSAHVGCWNCDDVYFIKIMKGYNCPEYLIKSKDPCRSCGCDSLKPYIEYINEKEIMKDVILHHRMQQMEEKEPQGAPIDHKHFG